MCYEAVDDYLPALTFIPDWFVTSKILEKFHNALLHNDDIRFLMKILIKSLTLISNYILLQIFIKLILMKIMILMKMILILLFMSDFRLGLMNLKNAKHLKKKITKELMPIAWHLKRWWNFCLLENEKKEIESVFTEKCF